ncbi:MAG: ATP-grasp domain-containing protein, partial [Clostridiales bacterium]|nr:ATP-grasp domain-containing protein [Clostridiales bacterium]
SEVIAVMGDKDQARQVMKKAGVPVIPGTGILGSVKEAAAAAEEIGYPVLIKARAGGGGKGIRIIRSPEELENAFHTASREARKAFGDGAVYMEKQIKPAKHIEVQILADETGNIVCLYERECSIQQSNQKLVEESPSPAVDEALRRKMADAAIAAARAVGYCNAGTIEFLLDKDNNFYFLEMNVRLQVEHGITEQITGIDIVKWQIRIASGVPLDFTQKDIAIDGCSIECRINASAVGKVTFFHVPGGPRVRFDSALWTGYVVPPFYDALLGKLIVHAKTRE